MDDLDQVADSQVSVDQVQSPLGLDLAAHHNIAHDVLSPRASLVAVYGDGEVGSVVVGNAFRCQHPGNADEWRVDRVRGSNPRSVLSLDISDDPAAMSSQVGVQSAATPSQRRWIGAC